MEIKEEQIVPFTKAAKLLVEGDYDFLCTQQDENCFSWHFDYEEKWNKAIDICHEYNVPVCNAQWLADAWNKNLDITIADFAQNTTLNQLLNRKEN